MKNLRSRARLSFLVVLLLAVIAAVSPSWASTGNIEISDLTGSWLVSLHGTTGCGYVDMEADVTLSSSGAGTATLITHGQCGDNTLTGQSFTIKTLKTDGQGTAGLSCGTACGWNFDIQVSPDRSKFNLVDVSSANPGNYVEGEAVLQSPKGNISISDLTGSWQATLFGITGCGTGSTVLNFTLNTSGVASTVDETNHTTGCGTSSGKYELTILTLNPDGSGTANISCGAGCGWNFDIQVSPDRSAFNLVDVSKENPGNFQAGAAINNSTAGRVVPADLAGNWTLVQYGTGGCGVETMAATFTLSAGGSSTNATEYPHSGCGNTVTTGNTFTITSLNADGSGTANLTCGTDCGFNYAIQVAADRSTFNLVDVKDGGNYWVGTAIHE